VAERFRILFVCMGNICRSPIAEAVTRTLALRQGLAALLEFDSAGTHGHYHAGEPPDARARRVALRRGYDLSRLRARCSFHGLRLLRLGLGLPAVRARPK